MSEYINNNLLENNIKVEIILTDIRNDNVVKGVMTSLEMKELHEKHNISGLDLLLGKLYNELKNRE